MNETRSKQGKTLARSLGAAAVGTVLMLASAGCKNNQVGQQAPIVDGNAGTDPSMQNMADPNAAYSQGSAPVAYARTAVSGTRTTGQTAAPITRVAGQVYENPGYAGDPNYPAPSTQNESSNYQYQQGYGQGAYDPNASVQDDQLYSELLDPNTPAAPQPPPELPVYEQPPAPGPDYLWTPGYWDYASTGYYYVPGNWVAAPFVGALWTPGWWGYYGNRYRWHHGYWGPHVGYYGGINYGFGFIGLGYQGGYWNRDHFYYNTYVNHVRPEVVNNYVYNRRVTVVNNTYINNTRVSYYGGPGGLQRRPAPAEFAAVRDARMAPLPGQVFARQQAAGNRSQFFAENHGRPSMLFASNPVVQHNVAVPAQLQHLQPNPQAFQQRIQAEQQRQGQNQAFRNNEQQQRMQADQQRQQQNQAFRNNEQQQRLQADQQRQQQNQAFRNNEQQQRLQADQQRQQQNQAFRNNEQQQRLQADQQRQQQNQAFRNNEQQQRLQADQQRQGQNQAFRNNEQQQRQQADQQRQQLANQQRQQFDQQHQQAANQQRQQLDQQRQQQMNQQRQQADQQRQQLANQQRQQFDQQRQQQMNQQRQQADQQRQQVQQSRPAEPQHTAAPPQHFDAPHGGPPQHGGGHEGGHGR